jgi:hypothetical protein
LKRKMLLVLTMAVAVLLASGFHLWQRESGSSDWRFLLNRPKVSRPISPLIYGMAAAPASVLRELRVPLNRWGGNTASRYNWKLGNAWNAGGDWYFMNVGVEADAWKGFLERTWDAGAAAILTVPLVGHVARDTRSYSFSIRKYGAQQGHAPENPDAGDGRLPGGRLLYGNDPRDANVPAGPAFVAEWMRTMNRTFPAPVHRGRVIVTLGNEPMLWNRTHRDVHPEPVTYDAYLARFIAMARAVRKEMPHALLAGPELWGWPALFQSARDRDVPGGEDQRTHDGEPFLPWFLRQLRLHETRHGECLLDVVTVHFYPQAQGVYSDAATLGHQLRRIATTRTLFDPDYVDPSWIDARVALIPRLRRWIDAHYPGRMLGITEYNWGGEKDISGAIALADVLGIFGREELDLACYWTHPPTDALAGRAYALYRNVDGRGATFGTHSWEVAWAGDGELPRQSCAVYAAELPEENMLTVVAINKSRQARHLRLRSDAGPWLFEEGYFLNQTTTNGITSLAIDDRPAEGEWLTLMMHPLTMYHLRLKLN